MKRTILILVGIIVVVGMGYLIIKSQPIKSSENNNNNNQEQVSVFDSKNATYIIEGKEVVLVDGKAEQETVPGSATKIKTNIFGEPTKADINGDGKEDAIMIIIQEPGGSGTFYYAAGSINDNGKALGSNAILLGDRIAPQNIVFENGEIIANYAERKKGEPMTAEPSVGVSRYFVTYGAELVEKNKQTNSNNFEIQGMKIEIIKNGAGSEAKNGNIITAHYVGTLENGQKFDSSIDRGEPFSFTLGAGEVIKGWDLGILGMKVGEKRKLTIPSDLAYGQAGIPGFISENATLIFEVELLVIE